MASKRDDTLGDGASAGALQIQGRSRIGQKLTRLRRYVQDFLKLTSLVFCLSSARTAIWEDILHIARLSPGHYEAKAISNALLKITRSDWCR